jgi:hypothetical protein
MHSIEESQAIISKEFKYNEMLYQINKENNLYYQRKKTQNHLIDF